MFNVAYKILLGSTIYTADKSTRLLGLRVNKSLQIPVNSCQLILSTDKSISVQPEDIVKVELGYKGESKQVFIGKIQQVNWGLETVELVAESSWIALVTAKLNLLYEKSTAANIVNDVAQRLKIKVNKTESGLKFPGYILSDSTSAYSNLKVLARMSGFDLYANEDDELIFAKYHPKTTHEFQYSQDILAVEIITGKTAISGVEVYGESPASQQGEKTYSWFAKAAVKGSSGESGVMTQRQFEPTAKTEDLAAKMAEAFWQVQLPQKQGWVKVMGNANVKLGDGVRLAGLPQSSGNGDFKVTGITHALNRHQGFWTKIDLEVV
ncbi:hypothetical protein [Nostoc sp. ChiQUE01b]|uniref:hypothetical protein n=1 Tax=Nostoc sp. ChiQUE01b TaxID=3075376 RepID=UPI002AD4AB73|nr:hypothetical protein [Nostoc sp. ChiQUE01b]MDZ8263311.1 hypothetical protein [Nostoc sp. ChiQUE01b]